MLKYLQIFWKWRHFWVLEQHISCCIIEMVCEMLSTKDWEVLKLKTILVLKKRQATTQLVGWVQSCWTYVFAVRHVELSRTPTESFYRFELTSATFCHFQKTILLMSFLFSFNSVHSFAWNQIPISLTDLAFFEIFTFSSSMRRYWLLVVNDFQICYQIFTFRDILSQKKLFLRKCLSVCLHDNSR